MNSVRCRFVQESQCAVGERRFLIDAIVVGRDKDDRHVFVDAAKARLHPMPLKPAKARAQPLARDVFSVSMSLRFAKVSGASQHQITAS
jgi:hypothetical protein